jgi:hypothetical protein
MSIIAVQEIAVGFGERSFHVFDSKSFQITKYTFGSGLLAGQLHD